MSTNADEELAGDEPGQQPGASVVWPRLFIPGVPKAGTTSLHRYLGQHPAISMSRDKEPDHFTTGMSESEGDPEASKAAIATYMDQFDDDGSKLRGEASCSYFTWTQAPERIQAVAPDAKFIFSLRDPVDRTYSYYLMEHRGDVLRDSFLEELETALAGQGTNVHERMLADNLYHTNITRFLDTFGQEQVKILLFDDLVEDPRRELRSIVTFLGLDTDPVDQIDVDKAHNPYRAHRGPLARFLRHDEGVKKLARKALPLSAREFIGEKLLMRKGEKPPLEDEAVELVWDQCGDEIDALEQLMGRELPELRKHA